MSRTNESGHVDRIDGSAVCAVCAHPALDDRWCTLVSGLTCAGCCDRIRSLDPDAVIEALSHAEMALSPDEVERACTGCQEVADEAASDERAWPS